MKDQFSLTISTHTLRKEGDLEEREKALTDKIFQPTPSARRVTVVLDKFLGDLVISTHTLRKEGDSLYSLHDL